MCEYVDMCHIHTDFFISQMTLYFEITQHAILKEKALHHNQLEVISSCEYMNMCEYVRMCRMSTDFDFLK